MKNPFTKRTLGKAGDYWKTLGPGLTTGAADDDPSGIATYSQAGAKYGFSFLWLALFTFPLMSVVQEIGAQKGLLSLEKLQDLLTHAPVEYRLQNLK